MIFGIDTIIDISKLSQISKYHSWYLCQISLTTDHAITYTKNIRFRLKPGFRFYSRDATLITAQLALFYMLILSF